MSVDGLAGLAGLAWGEVFAVANLSTSVDMAAAVNTVVVREPSW